MACWRSNLGGIDDEEDDDEDESIWFSMVVIRKGFGFCKRWFINRLQRLIADTF